MGSGGVSSGLGIGIPAMMTAGGIATGNPLLASAGFTGMAGGLENMQKPGMTGAPAGPSGAAPAGGGGVNSMAPIASAVAPTMGAAGMYEAGRTAQPRPAASSAPAIQPAPAAQPSTPAPNVPAVKTSGPMDRLSAYKQFLNVGVG